MEFSAEQKKYIIQRIKFSYGKGYYEGMVAGLMVGIVAGISIFNIWGDLKDSGA